MRGVLTGVADTEQLKSLFSVFGRVEECRVMLDKRTGRSRQIGFVRFVILQALRKSSWSADSASHQQVLDASRSDGCAEADEWLPALSRLIAADWCAQPTPVPQR
jgi:hypothetical protein